MHNLLVADALWNIFGGGHQESVVAQQLTNMDQYLAGSEHLRNAHLDFLSAGPQPHLRKRGGAGSLL